MFLTIGNMMKLLTFDKTKYDELVDNIEKSNGYVCYINSKKNNGEINEDYYRYLYEKQEMYTYYIPSLKREQNKIYEYFTIKGPSEENSDGEGLSKDIMQELYEKYGMSDDYHINTLEELSDGHCSVKLRQAIPIEKEICDIITQIDGNLEKINHAQLNQNFVFNDYRRFMLIPPLIKNSDGRYEVSIVLVTVYCTGIITFQLIITFTSDKLLEVSENPPRNMHLSEVSLHKIKDAYSKEDFWIKEKQYNANFDQLLNHYENLLIKIGKIKIESNHKNIAFVWTLGDFPFNKNSLYLGKTESYQKTLNYYLLNARKSIIDDLTRENLNNILKKSLAFEHKNLSFYSSTTNAVLYINKNKYLSRISDNLKEEEQNLKKANHYESVVLEQCKNITLVSMFDCIRFYELAFIKKYYIRNLIDNMASSKYQSLVEYKKLKKDLNFLNFKFDEEFLFPYEGSARELYRSILEKTETNILQTKAEFLIKSLSDDISQERESRIKQNETSIVIFSSIITIVLGYNGIKIIVNDILCNIPLFGYHINLHPLRWSIFIWSILVSVMVVFNVRRLRRNQ